jgi:signal transduction histidine kinase/ActR/RegA family two-component response regulator
MKGRMKPMFRGSLQRKLLGVMLVTAFVTVLVALGAMIGHDLRESHRGWVEEIAAQAELLGRTTAPALSFDDAAVAQENLTLLSRQQRIRAAAIYDARGHRVAMLLPDAAEPPLPVLPGADGVQVDGGYLHAFRRVVDQNQILGTVYLRAEYALYERMGRYAGIGAVVIAIAMLAALGVSFWLQRLVTRPVLGIAETARHVMERQDYTRRAGKTSDDEVGVLADAFNDMLSEIERRTRALEAASQEQERLNAELERRVQERTAQLQQSNQELSVATRAAEHASRAKSEFLSSMSHELRTPLNAIIGFGQLLASDRFPADEQQRRTFVDHIVKSGRHLLALINEVLNLAQIEAGRLTLSLEPVALQDVLDDSRAMVGPLAAPRGIRVLFPERCTYAVTADRTRLKQVLLNLLSNAVKYNRDQGAVVIDCTLPAPGRVRVSVQDTGRGLTPRQIESLFQPFNRLGQEAGEQEGTGVGLVVTKHLVEMMDGRIGVQSTPGAGSVFWVDLPQADGATVSAPVPLASAADDEAKHPPAVPPAPAPEDAEGATVLCVEDNPANLAFVRSALGHRPHLRLLTATDGRTGVELARAHRPQVILMDNNMPGLTGREALAVLMDDPATSGIPVIALTANAMPKAVDDGLAAGFFRYLTKPIDVDALIGAVDEALRESRDRGNG